MGGAILVGFFAFARARKLPQRREIDVRLVGGSIVFGIGWGLAGFCPGPALVDFGAGIDQAGVFLIAMIVGAATGLIRPAYRLAPALRRKIRAS